MNSSLKLIIRKEKCSKDGKHTIFLQYCYKDRINKKIIPYIDLSCFRSLQEDVDGVFLDWKVKEVAKLASINEPVKIAHKKGSRTIEEVRPKYAWVSSHTARRSFCTNEYLAGTPHDLIMGISGHKTEKAFRNYIKADKIKKASMIKQLWDDQPGL